MNREPNKTNQNVSKETRIPVPSFAKYHKRNRKVWNKNANQNKESIQKLDALNLEMSETFKQNQLKYVLSNQNLLTINFY